VPVALARLAADEPALRKAVVGLCADLLSERKSASGAGGAALQQSAVMAISIAADGDADPADVRARSLLRKLAAGDGDRLARRLALIAVARAAARPGSGSGWPSTVDDTRAFLTSEMERGSTPTRPWVGLALGILERGVVQQGAPASPAVHELLVRSLEQHSSPVEAGAYALGLGLFAGSEAQAPLLRVLATTRDDQVRGHASVGLGLARVTAGIEPLRRLVIGARYQPNLLREASIGLGLLGDKTISTALVDVLRDAQGLTAQAAIATALGYVGDARAVAPLLALASDQGESKGGRAYAIVALGLICDRRLLPWNTMIAADANYWLPPSTLFDPVTSSGVLDIL
jgi:hypothetical protein